LANWQETKFQFRDRLRGQSTLLPECLDDFIDERDAVRVIDLFVDALDLAEMSFDEPAATGRLSYHPSDGLAPSWEACETSLPHLAQGEPTTGHMRPQEPEPRLRSRGQQKVMQMVCRSARSRW
jgi:hypothetical protein